MDRQPNGYTNPLADRLGLRVRLSPMMGVFLTVFIDLLSFGLIIPDLQLRGNSLGLSGLSLGLTLATFSLAQLLTAPFLGRLSDRIGRRKVLVLTTLLSVASFVVYAHAHVPWMIVAARVLSGIAGANLPVAFAYISDITTPQNRAKGLGMVGAAFGLGFVLGPPLGAWLVSLGGGSPLILGYVAATLCAINFLYVLFLLPESLRAPKRTENARFLENFRVAFSTPGLAILLAMFFAVNFGFTNLETTYFQLLHDPRGIFHLAEGEARFRGALILALVGVLSAVMQGAIVRRLVPAFGEVPLVRFAYLLFLPTLAAVPFAPFWGPALLVTVVLSLVSGLAQPCISSLISRNAPDELQGGIFGITQALGALARVIGPLVSNTLFEKNPSYPYLLGAAIIVFPALAAWTLKPPPAHHTDEPLVAH